MATDLKRYRLLIRTAMSLMQDNHGEPYIVLVRTGARWEETVTIPQSGTPAAKQAPW